jgi:predicted  nucleic acid-binding Zn-ribbon protein
MLDVLKSILEIQDLDMKMIRLMRLKRERQREAENIRSLRDELRQQLAAKELEIHELKKSAAIIENRVQDITARIKKLENQQITLKKVDDFNACTHEINAAERERQTQEQQLTEMLDKVAIEEEILEKIKESMTASEENSKILETEIEEGVQRIKEEGRELLVERQEKAKSAPRDLLSVYEKLLQNKRDRVIVPVEQRACSGCHIVLTPQHENLVRKGDRMVFCEHCSRVLFWEEPAAEEATAGAKRRRRRPAATA